MVRKILSARPDADTTPSLGSGGDLKKYAAAYLDIRMWQFQTDIEICLRGLPNPSGDSVYMHAYFPALLLCCGTFELLANLYGGSVKPGKQGEARRRRLYAYGKMMPDNCYSAENIRVLFGSMRNALAHHATGGGVWLDKESSPIRRVVWKIYADSRYPALSIESERGLLVNHPPNVCRFTHRLHIRLDRFRCDIRDSVERPGGYKERLLSSRELLTNFRCVIDSIYPK